jgi:hypothetical protein
MRKHTNTALAVMVYDVLRLVVLLRLLTFSAGAVQRGLSIGGTGRIETIPYLFFAASQVVFPMIAFFLWLNRRAYRPFRYLYVAGKAAGVVMVGVWIGFYRSPALFVSLARLAPMREMLFQMALPIIAICDALSAVALAYACRYRQPQKEKSCVSFQ